MFRISRKHYIGIFYGIIAALGALVLELAAGFSFAEKIFFPGFSPQNLTPFLVACVIIEELVKLAVISKTSQKIERAGDILFNAFLIGAGFSLMEIFLVFSNEIFSGSVLYQGMAGIFAVHSGTSLIFGIFFIFRKRLKLFYAPAAFFAAFLLHLAANILLIYG